MAITPTTKQITVESVTSSIQKYGDRLLSWLGIAARGNLAKFNRTVGPVMAGQAIETGLPVFAFWFGQLILVNTSGQPTVYADQVTSSAQARNILEQLKAAGQSFWLFNCGAGLSTYTPEDISAHCTFEPHGSAAVSGGGLLNQIREVGIVGAGGGIDGILPVLLIGVAAWFFFGQGIGKR